MKRIILFVATNLAVVLVLSVVLKLFGLDRVMAGEGIQYGQLLVYSIVVGFTGAIISLLMSKTIAKWTTGAQVITTPRNEAEAWLVETVRKLAALGSGDDAQVPGLLPRPGPRLLPHPDRQRLQRGQRRARHLVAPIRACALFAGRGQPASVVCLPATRQGIRGLAGGVE